jgi:hypothetical protein
MNEQVEPKPKELKFRHGTLISLLAILSGVAALCMLPVGLFMEIPNKFWDIFFLSNISLLLLGAGVSLALLVKLSVHCRWNMALCLTLPLLFIGVILLSASTPIIARDALVHHLAVPRWWLEAKQIRAIQWHEWSYYPMLVNLGYAGLLQHGMEHLTPIYHFLHLLLLCGVTSAFCYHKTKEVEISYFAYVLTLTLPVCMRLAGAPLVDLGLALYVAIALSAIIYWSDDGAKFRWIVIAAIALGLACGCKYNGLLATGLILGLLLTFSTRKKIGFTTSFAALILCGCLALFVVMPWFVKNIMWTQTNPVYPLFRSKLSPQVDVVTPPSLKPLEKLHLLYGESAFDIAIMPLKMILTGQDDNPRLYDGRLSPILFLMIFPLFFVRKRPWVVFFYLYLIAYFYLAISLSSARIRYMAPLFFPLVALSCCGLQLCGDFFKGKYRYQLYSLIGVIHLLFAVEYSFHLLEHKQVFGYLDGEISTDDYYRKFVPEYDMVQYINKNLDGSSFTFLLLTGNKYYLYNKPVRSGGYFSANPIIADMKRSANGDEFAQLLEQKGIGHIMVHTERLKKLFSDLLKDEEKSVWNDFQIKHLVPIHQAGDYSLWKLQHTGAPGIATPSAASENPA